ncbi:hypothetical protein E0F15_11160 [Frankia sp. B2]|uniref:hypothetical protein n=1 Tax=Frankia sp. B2 TaxID=2541730 RepID=UPI00106C6100|nr:hypothetical protein [Frankia sp. B2]TFE31033.1 hypothetical protein E0F15_11160 [Frankia sp. B2]
MPLTDRVLVVLRDADDPRSPAENASTQMAVYFPDGCPDTRPPGLPPTEDYHPHADTVCPTCLADWTVGHLVSNPAMVPDGTLTAVRFTWPAEDF